MCDFHKLKYTPKASAIQYARRVLSQINISYYSSTVLSFLFFMRLGRGFLFKFFILFAPKDAENVLIPGLNFAFY